MSNLFIEYQNNIDKALRYLLANDPSLDDLRLTNIHEAISYSSIGAAKRIRAILSLLTAEAVMCSDEHLPFGTNPASGLALALELIHAGSLIHDDLPCMDNDDLRRGKPSSHIKFGEASALLTGDVLLTYPLRVLFTETPKSYHADQVQIELIDAINSMIAGQAIDLAYTNTPKTSLQVSQLEQMHKLKTGALLRASIKLAAILANANVAQVRSLTAFADNIGLAFQIVDDILDHTSDSQALGKTSGKDQQQNKITYLSFYDVNEARDLAYRLIRDAKKNIEQIDIYTDKLNLVADYVISRAN
jgi:farnesyl diphosphate synthase